MRYWFLFMMWALLSVACSAEETPRKLKPVMVWTGTDSKQAKESFTRCCSQKDWEVSWHKHQGGDGQANHRTCPEIDFDSYMVIVIFHGKSSQNIGINIVDVFEDKESFHVRYKPLWYQIGILLGANLDQKQLDTQSYVFIVLPKSQKAIVLEENVSGVIVGPPIWKERTKMPPLKTDR
jgi:hypothetical protein